MACPYLLASLLFHEDWLREHLPQEYSIFQSRVFNYNPYLDELKKHSRTGEGYCSDKGYMYVIYSICMSLRAIVNMKRETELCYGTVYTSLNKVKHANGSRRRGRVESEEQDI